MLKHDAPAYYFISLSTFWWGHPASNTGTSGGMELTLLWLKALITNFAISFVKEGATSYSAYSSLSMFVAFALHLHYVHSFVSDSC